MRIDLCPTARSRTNRKVSVRTLVIDKGYKLTQDDESQGQSLEAANQEMVFLQLTSVFVGAIRCGVLDVEHAKEPLAHYGRISATFDAVARKLVDVLRDEGIYNEEATTVQHVASSALQSVSSSNRILLVVLTLSHSASSLTQARRSLLQLSPFPR